MLSDSNMTPADIKAVLGNNDGLFGGGGNSAWFLIILFLFAFVGGWGGRGGFGGGGNGGGVTDGYVLASDMSRIQSTITQGLCDGFYSTAQLINGTNMNLASGFAGAELSRANQQAALMQQLNNMAMQNAQCCCEEKAQIADVKYAMAMNSNAETNAINTGFCQTNYNNSNNTRDIIDNQNANARAILEALNRQSLEAKDAKIAEQNQQIFNLQLAASQARQNELLIDRLGYHCPQPAYVVQPPQQVTFPTNGCGIANYAAYNSGCGCNV